ncbi:DUF1614 domain-containing protein [Phosphitispora fastidiosa]|uniref:DUF1614 domain-containing protein n=1 Tax=Phosphitispora fastidiosa TaxID=2837202 RepID=UPI001E59C768|nr:DUF1614 domain-containing protein [Phosphitispora fastidiosa]MBU7005551.1 putative membrane protein [Phosphitispora fastidiosa]
MTRFPLGIIALVIVSVLVYFGLAHRILDRLRISDKVALGILAAMVAGSFVDIPIAFGRIDASVNVGGGLIPIGLAIYVLTKAGTKKEWFRTLIATGVTGVVIYYIGSVLMQGNPGGPFDRLDPIWMYPIIGGVVAYVAGRSRRSAFIAATLGVLLLDIFNWVYLLSTGTPGRIAIGGAGAFDSIVLAGIIAVLLAEIIGESRERLQGGPASRGRDPELLSNLENAEYASTMGIKDNSIKDKGIKEKPGLQDSCQKKKEAGDSNE